MNQTITLSPELIYQEASGETVLPGLVTLEQRP